MNQDGACQWRGNHASRHNVRASGMCLPRSGPMQYELLFIPQGVLRPDRAAFERYFAARDHYTVRKGHARYENEDTGVYFSFEYMPDPAARPSEGASPWVTFSLALVRPSFFAEEGSIELSAFVAAFGPTLIQPGAQHVSEFSTTTFLRDWESRNRAACGLFTMQDAGAERPLTLPRSRLLAAWQWNYRRKMLQVKEGEGLFVPRVWFMRLAEGVGTSIVWPDAMAVRAPQVDRVIFSREALAPRTRLRGRRPDVAVVPWSTVAASITGSAFYDSLLVSWRVSDPKVLNALTHVVSTLRGTTDIPDLVADDKVLDREGFESGTAPPTPSR